MFGEFPFLSSWWKQSYFWSQKPKRPHSCFSALGVLVQWCRLGQSCKVSTRFVGLLCSNQYTETAGFAEEKKKLTIAGQLREETGRTLKSASLGRSGLGFFRGSWKVNSWKIGVICRGIGMKLSGCKNCILLWVSFSWSLSDQLVSVASLVCRIWKNISSRKLSISEWLNCYLQRS